MSERQVKDPHPIRKHIREVALLAWVLIGAGLLLHALFVTGETAAYALAGVVAWVVWMSMKLNDDADQQRRAMKSRDALVRSVLKMPLNDLHYLGITDDLTDRILRDSSLRAKYFRVLEDLHLDLDELLRANVPRGQLEQLLKQAEEANASDTGDFQ